MIKLPGDSGSFFSLIENCAKTACCEHEMAEAWKAVQKRERRTLLDNLAEDISEADRAILLGYVLAR